MTDKFVKQYQCVGCVNGTGECFSKDDCGIGCGKHFAGTMATPFVGSFLLGLPKGFCRLGEQKDLRPKIFETSEQQEMEWEYDELNVPIWKHKTKEGHIIIRGYMPRLNIGFIHIILKGDFDRIKGFEITEEYMRGID